MTFFFQMEGTWFFMVPTLKTQDRYFLDWGPMFLRLMLLSWSSPHTDEPWYFNNFYVHVCDWDWTIFLRSAICLGCQWCFCAVLRSGLSREYWNSCWNTCMWHGENWYFLLNFIGWLLRFTSVRSSDSRVFDWSLPVGIVIEFADGNFTFTLSLCILLYQFSLVDLRNWRTLKSSWSNSCLLRMRFFISVKIGIYVCRQLIGMLCLDAVSICWRRICSPVHISVGELSSAMKFSNS